MTLSQVTGNKQGEEGGANQLLSLAQNALAAFRAGRQNTAPGQLIGTIGGDNVKQILSQLGIDPAVAENPESASEEDLQKIADHIGRAAMLQRIRILKKLQPTHPMPNRKLKDDNVSAEDQP